MKKHAIASVIAMTLGTTGALTATSAQAAFTAMADGNYTMTIDGGCFGFNDCSTATSGVSTLVDATTQNQADTSGFGYPYGSGVANDGVVGTIDFTLSGGSFSVTSFEMDGYQDTTGGTFYTRVIDYSGFVGTIDGSGNMTMDPTGRLGMAASYINSLGEQIWSYAEFTTGSSTNQPQGLDPAFTLTGTALTDNGSGGWTGTLVSAGNIGAEWGNFETQRYSELYNVTITANPVPVPAAVWLFGSGLMGLVGVARRRKA